MIKFVLSRRDSLSQLVMGLLVGSMHEHAICCIVHIILCSLTVWFSVNVNWYGIKRNFVSSYYCPRRPKVCYSVTPSDKIHFLANQQHCTEAKVASTRPSTQAVGTAVAECAKLE